MPLVGALVVVVLLLFTLWIAIARESGPGPADVALAYERAWGDLEFGLLYDLSGDELRDGLRRDQFVASKRSAYAHANARLAARIEVETVVAGHQTALAVTRVVADDGSVRNNVLMERRSNGWVVVGYSLRSDAAAS